MKRETQKEKSVLSCMALNPYDRRGGQRGGGGGGGGGVERIDFEMWCDAWDTEGVQRLHAGMGGVLGAILQHRSRIT